MTALGDGIVGGAEESGSRSHCITIRFEDNCVCVGGR